MIFQMFHCTFIPTIWKIQQSTVVNQISYFKSYYLGTFVVPIMFISILSF